MGIFTRRADPFAPNTGNRQLDKQLQARRNRTLREFSGPAIITPQIAAHARDLMLDACDGHWPIQVPADVVLQREDGTGPYVPPHPRSEDLNGEEEETDLESLKALGRRERWRYLERLIFVNMLTPIFTRFITSLFNLASLAVASKLLYFKTLQDDTSQGPLADYIFILIICAVSTIHGLVLTYFDFFLNAFTRRRRAAWMGVSFIWDVFLLLMLHSTLPLAFKLKNDKHQGWVEALEALLIITTILWFARVAIVILRLHR